MSNPDQVEPGPVVLVADPNHAAMDPKLDGYLSRKKFRLRVWWVPDWGEAGRKTGRAGRSSARRGGSTPTATMDEWMYVREDVAELVATSPAR